VPFTLPVSVALAAACDGQDRETVPRFYYPPDATEEAEAAIEAAVPSDASIDAVLDATADAEAEAPRVVRALATGSATHPDPLVGGGDHTCVIAGAARAVYCWGANDYGQIGNGKTGLATPAEDVATATKIAVDETGLPFDGAEELALSAWHSCARRGDVLFCWGQRLTGAQAEPPGPNADRTAPRAIGNFDVKRIAAGGPHTCALKSNGKMACFGHSAHNELGRANADDAPCTAPFFYDYNGSATHQCAGTLVEVMFGALAGSTSLAAGETHSCALAGAKVHCWGSATQGKLGRPLAQATELNAQLVVTDPTTLAALDGVSAIANDGARHTCALRSASGTAGAVFCWGPNEIGQLGADPLATPVRAFAAAVPGITGATGLGVADGVSCAVRADATVACWGTDLAALGDGGIASTAVPTPVKGPGGAGLLTSVVAVAPGVRHACALRKDGTVWCWGKNDRGQLGDGTKVDSAYPVKVVGLPLE